MISSMADTEHDKQQEGGVKVDKELLAAFPDEFKGMAEEAMAKLVKTNRDEAVGAIHRLIVKEYQTQRDIRDAENRAEKGRESLKKTQEKLTKLRSGDLSVLFSN